MKIRELHLRNIASIEVADIDFDKGLCDGVTGAPASVFLISGDTGAGKSIILDGISMALYKKTPRLTGVSNPKKNSFMSTDGESINVGSIEQYTRLGISPKDECYSEVVFTGNDGVEYHAKLSLGMKLGNSDKNTGRRGVSHRKPKWEVRSGNGDWSSSDVERIIQDAVGLTFEQFGRMAMLAQGQFAAFLTGDKKERESILEQLTDTSHFSEYGDAIKNLYNKAKADLEKIEVVFVTEAQHKLPQENVMQLQNEHSSLMKQKEDSDKKAENNDKIISLVKAAGDARAAAGRYGKEKMELEEEVGGEQYKKCKSLAADWDETETERQKLSELTNAEKALKTAMDAEAKEKDIFTILCSDLKARIEALESQGNPQKVADEKQQEIDALSEGLKSLEPDKVNSTLLALSKDRVALSALSSRSAKIAESSKALEGLKNEISDGVKKEEDYLQAMTVAEIKYKNAKSKENEAKNRYLTMKASVSETLGKVRKRLIEEHSRICPLCGQQINHISLDEEFKEMIAPLDKAHEDTVKEAEAAEQVFNYASGTYNKYAGEMSGKKKDYEDRGKALADEQKKLEEDAAKFNIDTLLPLNKQIVEAAESMDRQIAELKEKQSQASELQRKLAEEQKQKNRIDKDLRKYKEDENTVNQFGGIKRQIIALHKDWDMDFASCKHDSENIATQWQNLFGSVSKTSATVENLKEAIDSCSLTLKEYYEKSGKDEKYLQSISANKDSVAKARQYVKDLDERLKSRTDAEAAQLKTIDGILKQLGILEEKDMPKMQDLEEVKMQLKQFTEETVGRINVIDEQLKANTDVEKRLAELQVGLDKAKAKYTKWDILNGYFGGTRFRSLVQTYILRPLLNNANIYLERITDRYKLTCSEENEQLSILVRDRYNKDQIRSVTVLSGGERFMISLSLSLALSSLNRPDMNVNILFIDEGFGTLDEKNLDSVMETLERLQEIAGESGRRVGIISHREELDERIPVQIHVKKKGEGRSCVEIMN